MLNTHISNEERIIEIAEKMGYDPKKPKELMKYKTIISQMDEWDISRILFFGRDISMRQH